MRRPLLTTTMALTLLVTSGAVATAQEDAESQPAGNFEPTGSLVQARAGHTATLMPDGRVLVSGGGDVADEIWDPMTGLFATATDEVASADDLAPPLAVVRVGHTTTLLPDGSSLVVGGRGPGDAMVTEAQVYEPGSRRLAPAGSLAEPRTDHTSTFLRDGRVLVVGGTGAGGPLASAEVWTSSTRAPKCFGKRPTLFARPGVEFVGTPRADVIAGSVGADIIRGLGGNDRICAGAGANQVDGGGGNDRLSSGLDDDRLNGGKGNDVCNGGEGIDWQPNCNEKAKTRGIVTVTKNTRLKGPHKGRFIIGRDGVTLDCDGHTVTGAGRKVLEQPAITLLRRKDVTVRNCDIRGHHRGIWVERSKRNTFTDNRVSHVGDGFVLINSALKNKLIGNRVSDGDISGYALVGADDNLLRDNVATGFKGHGFSLWAFRGNTFTGNIARNNKLNGFHAGFTGPGQESIRNTFSGNSATNNRKWGFGDRTLTGDAGTDNQYEDNSCGGNRRGDSSPATLCD